MNDKQVKFLKDNEIFDFYRRSKGAEGVTLPEITHWNGDYALKNALFLGKHGNNDVWLSDDGNFKEITGESDFKENDGNIKELLGVYNGEKPGDTIHGVASVAPESTGGRKSRKTIRKKRKSKKSKKSRKSRK